MAFEKGFPVAFAPRLKEPDYAPPVRFIPFIHDPCTYYHASIRCSIGAYEHDLVLQNNSRF
jgi:hypothetical protein